MRRVAFLFLAVIAVIAMVAPDVSAQPKVTITGLIDNITSWSSNMNHEDSNPARHGDTEWYARTRVRPDIMAEVGTTKFVLGLEIDYAYGQTGATDGSFGGAGPQKFGTTSGADQNTDMAGILELKWAYTEFALPGMPWSSVMRVGAQPSAVMYKPAILQQGDFAGVHLTTTITPIIKLNLTYSQIEEESTGLRDGFPRGEDWAVFASVEVTPIKGLDIRPIYSYARIEGDTGQARLGRGGVANVAPAVAQSGICVNAAGAESLLNAGACPAGQRTLLARVAATNGFAARDVEERHTLGVDARWRLGPFSLDPTVMYQFGSRQLSLLNPPLGAAFATSLEQTRSAWLFDVRGGWQAGPLLLEVAGIYTTGNKAGDAVHQGEDLDFYEPVSTDSGFYGGWAEIWALNIDYFNSLRPRASGLNTITAIGYDKYGLIRAGARASYALTPAFTLRTAVTANWTAEEVDTSSTLVNASGLTPGDGNGDARYLGTELNLGFQWRFAPNVAFDVVGSYMFSGNALSTHTTVPNAPRAGNPGGVNGRDPQDIQAVTARVRYTF